MYLKVKVFPGAKKEVCHQISFDLFEVSVKTQPKRNQANRRMVELLAEYLKILPGQIRVISGHHSRRKIVEVPFDELFG